MKSLAGEFTQNEKWSVKGTLMGECWYKNCCVSEHPDSLRCGKPEIEDGDEKMRMLIPVSYTHLDVYKRQLWIWRSGRWRGWMW